MLILIFTQKLFEHFPKQWLRMNAQREKNWRSSIHLENFNFFGEHC